MLNQQTIEKLYTMRMRGMADAFTQQQEDPQSTQLGFEERFGLLVDRQWNWRQNRALERRLRDGRLQGPACIEDIDLFISTPRVTCGSPLPAGGQGPLWSAPTLITIARTSVLSSVLIRFFDRCVCARHRGPPRPL